jgi:hypothetical protein
MKKDREGYMSKVIKERGEREERGWDSAICVGSGPFVGRVIATRGSVAKMA